AGAICPPGGWSCTPCRRTTWQSTFACSPSGSRTDGPCVPCLGLPVRDGDRDVRHGLVDRERPTLGPGAPPLAPRVPVRTRIGDVQVIGRQAEVVLGVRGRALEHAR